MEIELKAYEKNVNEFCNKKLLEIEIQVISYPFNRTGLISAIKFNFWCHHNCKMT